MTTSSSTFPESERYKPADLDIGAIIPKKTYISGRLVLLFPVEGDHSDRLRFAVRAKYQANVAEIEYVAASPSISDKWKFMFHLEPRRLPPPASASSGQTIKEAVLAEHERMALCMGAEIRMMADDLRIIKVDGKNVDFEAVGPRTMWTEKTGSWTIFQGTSKLKGSHSNLRCATDIVQIQVNHQLLHLGLNRIGAYHRPQDPRHRFKLKLDRQTFDPSPLIYLPYSIFVLPTSQSSGSGLHLPKNYHETLYWFSASRLRNGLAL
jgi:hypothetical protein